MNKQIVMRVLGAILLIEAACMVPSLLIALAWHDPGDLGAMGLSIALLAAVGAPLMLLPRKGRRRDLNPREGFGIVAAAWVLMSIFGAMPFIFSGLLPNFWDALFESVSGFTTTGSSVMTRFDRPLHGVMFWRSFTHWIGGMGVLVLTLALLPRLTGRTANLVRAESPGPSLSKLMPKMGDSAKVLYIIYAALTVIMFIALLLCGMTPYDAALHAIGTAGTGGFSNYGQSVGAFHSVSVEIVITVFMLLFGVNFALYYKLVTGSWREALRNEELRIYLCIALVAMLLLAVLIVPVYGGFGEALRYSSFTVATLMSTTGFGTADFNHWPAAAQQLVVLLMFLGGCVGSTAGGMKIMRIALLTKMARREVGRTFQPRKVKVVRLEGRGVDESILYQIAVFAVVYVAMIFIGACLVSLDGRMGVLENLTAALTCVSNVGPGLGLVGPAGNFAGYSGFSKLVLSVLMLAGRLELFPILALLHPSLWKRS